MMNYDEADKAIRVINRENLRIFSRLKSKLARWDELNVIRNVSSAYDESIAMVERWFLQVAQKAYLEGNPKKRRSPLDLEWLLLFLEATDPVTLYVFLNEAERKKARLLEALAVAQDKGAEIDKALRLWTRQIGWTAISVVDAATLEAYEDAGVKKVKWLTQHDLRVCDECWDRDGVIYDIRKVPPKPHPGCRCKLVPVRT